MKRVLLSGNEAIARGAWEAGVAVGVAYPGTPSTEILENLALMQGVRSEWAPNEKVALEVAIGVSMGGRRAMATMKHVGLNVAADPLYTLAYTGVRGGLVLIVADDPGMHSSQNEQDTRHHAAAAMVPILEPSDSQEALEFVRIAFELSEAHDVPVIVRSTTRLAHSKGLVDLGERAEVEHKGYESDPAKYVMIPGFARRRRVDLERRLVALAEAAESLELNTIHRGDAQLGIVTSGVTYQHVREALPQASVFKLGMTFPIPARALSEFADSVEELHAVEELSPFLVGRLRLAGIKIADPLVPLIGELTPGAVAEAFGQPIAQPGSVAVEDLPARPPLLCAGCPHRGVFWALRKMKAVVMGDIGCYTLGALPPLSSMDACVCMGAGIGMAHGLEISGGEPSRPVVAVIGDSTFAHSGLTGLVNAAYNQGSSTVVIMDNRTTAMTGRQENPVTGRTLMGEDTYEMDLEAISYACGATSVVTVDPHDLEATEEALRAEVARKGLSVVVTKAPCALLARSDKSPFAVDVEACTACKACVRLGCPAISLGEGDKAAIDTSQCVGCAQCVMVCKFDAILPAGPACDIGGGLT